MSPERIRIDYILFDMIGTTVKDNCLGESLILDCFRRAFKSEGYEIGHDKLNNHRGKSKHEAIVSILIDEGLSPCLADTIYTKFIDLLNLSVSSFLEMDGASELFVQLKEKNIKIGIGSGLPGDFMKSLIKQVRWDPDIFDYIGSSEDLGKGRPDPVMIFDSMRKLNLTDPKKVLKTGDTAADILEGKNAGVLTAGVFTGTQTSDQLSKYNPDYLIKDINELLNIV